MDYVTPDVAREMKGLRLALTAGVPGPWSEAAKAVLTLRGIDYVPVLQAGGQANPELVAWTGHRNAPVAMYEDEAPRVRWLEIVQLAERLGSGPSLIPEEIHDRIQMVGLTDEIAGENGMGWNGRHLMLSVMHKAQGDAALETPLFLAYGYNEESLDQATSRVSEILDLLAQQIQRQAAAGSRYLIGESLTAADVYWAFFSQLLDAFPEEQNPMPKGIRAAWQAVAASVGQFDPVLIEHRDAIFERHLTLPLDF